jgi:uncharacterized delta-60 repeat protein
MIDIVRHRRRPARPWAWDRLEERTLLNAASPDPSFGTGGHVTTDFPLPGAETVSTSVIIDSRGRAIVAGVVSDAQDNNRVVVARYLPDGRLDKSFGDGGKVYTPIDQIFTPRTNVPPYLDIPVARLTLDSRGRILVAGTNTAAPVYGPAGPNFSPDLSTLSDFAVVRLGPDGRLDTSFGTAGMTTIDVGVTDPNTGQPVHTDDFASGIAVQKDGQIVISGTTVGVEDVDFNFAVVRLTPDGSIDTGFGSDGRAIADFPAATNSFFPTPSFDTAESLALAPDGTIVVGGVTNPNLFDPLGTGDDFAVARFDTDGTLDASFGSGGLVAADLGQGQPGSLDQAYAVVVQPDGKIVLGGESTNICGATGTQFALLRLNQDGTRDTSFGSDGQVLTPIPGYDGATNSIGDLALQPDGKIVAGGYNFAYPSSTDFVLARYNPDGSLDTGFGSGGLVAADPPTASRQGWAIALQPRDGKIVFAGSDFYQSSSFSGFIVERFNADGSVDTRYGTGGTTMTQFTGLRSESSPLEPLVLPDGKVVVAVTTSAFPPGASGTDEFGLVEYNPDGRLNTHFGTGGRVTVDFGLPPGQQYNFPTGLALEVVAGTPRIVVVGSATPAGSYGPEIGVARFNLDGSPDTSFGTGGTVIVNPPEPVSPGGVAVQPDGDIVVVGTAGNLAFNNEEFAVVRLRTDGSLDPSFGSGGIVLTDLSPSGSPGTVQAGASSVLIQPDGRIVVGGIASVPTGPYSSDYYYALARYDLNGQLDPSFGSGGTDVIQTSGVDIDLGSVVSMALQGDGKFVVAGSAYGAYAGLYGTTDDLAIVRVTSQGGLDPSFGNGGVVITDLTPSGAVSPNDDHGTGVVIQPDGKIVVGGWTQNPGSSVPGSVYMAPALVLLRYEPDGSLDPSFGSGGIAITGLAGTAGVGLTMQPDGKLLMSYAATANPFGGTNLGVARFLGMDLAISGPSSGARGTPLTFTGRFDGQAADPIVGALWSFGDGTFAVNPGEPGGTALQATHAYDRPGTYALSLFVLFPSGGLLVTSYRVTITGHGRGREPDATGRGGPVGAGAVDAAISAFVGSLGLGSSSQPGDLEAPGDGAFHDPATGPGADVLYQELAGELLFDDPSAGRRVNIADETPAAKARRISLA